MGEMEGREGTESESRREGERWKGRRREERIAKEMEDEFNWASRSSWGWGCTSCLVVQENDENKNEGHSSSGFVKRTAGDGSFGNLSRAARDSRGLSRMGDDGIGQCWWNGCLGGRQLATTYSLSSPRDA